MAARDLHAAESAQVSSKNPRKVKATKTKKAKLTQERAEDATVQVIQADEGAMTTTESTPRDAEAETEAGRMVADEVDETGRGPHIALVMSQVQCSRGEAEAALLVRDNNIDDATVLVAAFHQMKLTRPQTPRTQPKTTRKKRRVECTIPRAASPK